MKSIFFIILVFFANTGFTQNFWQQTNGPLGDKRFFNGCYFRWENICRDRIVTDGRLKDTAYSALQTMATNGSGVIDGPCRSCSDSNRN